MNQSIKAEPNGTTKLILGFLFTIIMSTMGYFSWVQADANARQDSAIERTRSKLSTVEVDIGQIKESIKGIDKDTTEIKDGIKRLWQTRDRR